MEVKLLAMVSKDKTSDQYKCIVALQVIRRYKSVRIVGYPGSDQCKCVLG